MFTSQDWRAAVFKLEKDPLLCEEQVCGLKSGATILFFLFTCYYHDYRRSLLEKRQVDFKRKCLKLWKVCIMYVCSTMLLYAVLYIFTCFVDCLLHLSWLSAHFHGFYIYLCLFVLCFPIYMTSLMMTSERLVLFQNTK